MQILPVKRRWMGDQKPWLPPPPPPPPPPPLLPPPEPDEDELCTTRETVWAVTMVAAAPRRELRTTGGSRLFWSCFIHALAPR